MPQNVDNTKKDGLWKRVEDWVTYPVLDNVEAAKFT